jgi:hypothetical protein
MYSEFEDSVTLGVITNSFSPFWDISGAGCPSMDSEADSTLKGTAPGVVNRNALETSIPVLVYATGVRVYPSFSETVAPVTGTMYNNITIIKPNEIVFFIV